MSPIHPFSSAFSNSGYDHILTHKRKLGTALFLSSLYWLRYCTYIAHMCRFTVRSTRHTYNYYLCSTSLQKHSSQGALNCKVLHAWDFTTNGDVMVATSIVDIVVLLSKIALQHAWEYRDPSAICNFTQQFVATYHFCLIAQNNSALPCLRVDIIS